MDTALLSSYQVDYEEEGLPMSHVSEAIFKPCAQAGGVENAQAFGNLHVPVQRRHG